MLETAQYYISISADGVVKDRKAGSIKEYEQPGEWFDLFVQNMDDGEASWVDYESTLFVGERLLSADKKDDCFVQTFDDFILKVIPHPLNESEFPSLYKKNHWPYNHVLGSERHLKSVCDCGRKGSHKMPSMSGMAVI